MCREWNLIPFACDFVSFSAALYRNDFASHGFPFARAVEPPIGVALSLAQRYAVGLSLAKPHRVAHVSLPHPRPDCTPHGTDPRTHPKAFF